MGECEKLIRMYTKVLVAGNRGIYCNQLAIAQTWSKILVGNVIFIPCNFGSELS